MEHEQGLLAVPRLAQDFAFAPYRGVGSEQQFPFVHRDGHGFGHGQMQGNVFGLDVRIWNFLDGNHPLLERKFQLSEEEFSARGRRTQNQAVGQGAGT